MDLLGPCTNVFLTAYAHVRTEPQSDIGQTRGKKTLWTPSELHPPPRSVLLSPLLSFAAFPGAFSLLLLLVSACFSPFSSLFTEAMLARNSVFK